MLERELRRRGGFLPAGRVVEALLMLVLGVLVPVLVALRVEEAGPEMEPEPGVTVEEEAVVPLRWGVYWLGRSCRGALSLRPPRIVLLLLLLLLLPPSLSGG